MKNLPILISFLLLHFFAICQTGDIEFKVQHKKEIGLEFFHTCLTSHKRDTVIIHGLSAGARYSVRFDQGPYIMIDSMCILIPYGTLTDADTLGKAVPQQMARIFGGSAKKKEPERIDSGEIYVHINEPGQEEKTISRRLCIIPIASDSLNIYWGPQQLHAGRNNKMTRQLFKLLSKEGFTFSFTGGLRAYDFQAVSIQVADGYSLRGGSCPGNHLAPSLLRMLKRIKQPFTFSLGLYKLVAPGVKPKEDQIVYLNIKVD